MHNSRPYFSAIAGLLLLGSVAVATDWPRFRGPNGSGVSEETTPTPVTWSPDKNLKWKVKLPGPGSSCPIIVGDKIFVTSWSGYGTERGDRGKQDALLRHLTCLDRETGKTIWDKTVKPYLPEDEYGGMFAEHGYCTHTPASDGERVYVFFGKTGALAFDMEGNQLWQTPLGTDSNRMNWGSSSSPVLYKNLVIVTAAMESQKVYALDKATGKVVWQAEADALAATWGTPVLVEVDADRTDLVIGVPDEIWGFNPDTGKLRWYCEALKTRSFCSSVITDNKVIYAMGDQGSGSIAIKAGGKDDITKSNVLWTGRDNNRIGTPVLADGKLYFVSNRVATCVDAKTGDRIYQGRLGGGSAPIAQDEGSGGGRGAGGPGRGGPGGGGPGGGGGRGGRGGGGGGQDYSSPVVADNKMYYIARNGEAHVIKLGDKFEQLATNRVTEDTEDFSATPAISDGALYIRSSKYLYCIAEEAKSK
jgi:outer membrane protein assembly factor BamB